MNKSQIISCPDYFQTYINYTKGELLNELIENSPINVFSDIQKLKEIKDDVYAIDKWTIKQIIQHCIDTERIMAYRALRIARGDSSPLEGFDEANYALAASVSERKIEDLLEEFEIVRKGSISLFKSFKPSYYKNIGVANAQEVCPLALGLIIVGHTLHHYNVINQKYFPLL